MKILVTMGSPRHKGNTNLLAQEFVIQAKRWGHSCDLINLNKRIYPCQHCGFCNTKGHCFIDDEIFSTLNSIKNYDTIILASPIYFFSLNAQTKLFLDRLYSINLEGKKIGAILVSGSDLIEGGGALTIEMLKKSCDYCGAKWVGAVHKTTNDEILPVNIKDTENIINLINTLENDTFNYSHSYIK